MSSLRHRLLIILVLLTVALAGPWSVSPAVAELGTISAEDSPLAHPGVDPTSGEPDVGQTAPNTSGAGLDGYGDLRDWVRTTMLIWTTRLPGLGF